MSKSSSGRDGRALTIVIVVVLVIVVVVGGGLLVFRSMMNAPLYQPGMVVAGDNPGTSLDPPRRPDGADATGDWIVEEGISLHRSSGGEGAAVLVVHGGPGLPFLEAPAGLRALEDGFTVHYYDQRGCGRSTRPITTFEGRNKWRHIKRLERTLGLGAQVADIERIRRILGVERLRLIGHSFGGLIAAMYAAEFPERVASMVLVAPADMLVMPSPTGGLFPAIRERLPENSRDEYDGFVDRYLDLGSIFSKTEADLIAIDRELAGYYARAAGLDEAAIPETGAGWMSRAMYFSLGREHDYRSALRDVDVPVLVVHGADDLQPEEASRAWADAFPNANLVTIEGCGHFPFVDATDRFAEVARAHLAGAKP